MKKQRRVKLRKIIENLNLSEAEKILKSKYCYTPGKPGRPPLSPIGMFLTSVIKASKTRIKTRYPKKFLKRYAKRGSVERFFSRLKEFLDLKKLHVYGKYNVLIYSYIIIIGMLLMGYINSMYGFSPRSVKTFLRKFT